MSLTGVLCEDNLTNLDDGSAFSDEFKKSVLSFHMRKHAREISEKEIERIVSKIMIYLSSDFWHYNPEKLDFCHSNYHRSLSLQIFS
jgi:hypothetical protein